jgi:hypothetical protein
MGRRATGSQRGVKPWPVTCSPSSSNVFGLTGTKALATKIDEFAKLPQT